jgi:predicted nucleic acid-binding protein
MTLNDLPDGATVYLDANIFVCDFTGQSAECATLLLRTKAGEMTAVTGAQVITETVHRLMVIEAVERGLITAGNPARKLRQHPEVVRQLTRYWQAIEKLRTFRLRIFPLTMADVRRSQAIRDSCGLLTMDSTIIAMMQRRGVMSLAPLHSDFERVPGISLYLPGDVGMRNP